MTTERRLILRFRGTPADLVRFLSARLLAYDEEFDWEVTRAISRHPAGKGLSSGLTVEDELDAVRREAVRRFLTGGQE